MNAGLQDNTASAATAWPAIVAIVVFVAIVVIMLVVGRKRKSVTLSLSPEAPKAVIVPATHPESPVVSHVNRPSVPFKIAMKTPNQVRVDARSVGSRVEVLGYGQGTLVFYGPHATRPGYRCGVRLDMPTGLNNGTVEGHTYFDCPPKHGVLVRYFLHST